MNQIINYVYVINDSHDNYKIGYSYNPRKRINGLQSSFPEKLEFVFIIPTLNAFKLEHQLHKQFHDKRLTGEWFKLDCADLGFIRNLQEEMFNTINPFMIDKEIKKEIDNIS